MPRDKGNSFDPRRPSRHSAIDSEDLFDHAVFPRGSFPVNDDGAFFFVISFLIVFQIVCKKTLGDLLSARSIFLLH